MYVCIYIGIKLFVPQPIQLRFQLGMLKSVNRTMLQTLHLHLKSNKFAAEVPIFQRKYCRFIIRILPRIFKCECTLKVLWESPIIQLNMFDLMSLKLNNIQRLKTCPRDVQLTQVQQCQMNLIRTGNQETFQSLTASRELENGKKQKYKVFQKLASLQYNSHTNSQLSSSAKTLNGNIFMSCSIRFYHFLNYYMQQFSSGRKISFSS